MSTEKKERDRQTQKQPLNYREQIDGARREMVGGMAEIGDRE